MAEIGTPRGSRLFSESEGHCAKGAVKRALGCAAFVDDCGVHSFPIQSIPWDGGFPNPSHHGLPSSVLRTLVNSVLRCVICSALGLVRSLVPGATPKNPASGLSAHKRP